jgi:hypothetical protein
MAGRGSSYGDGISLTDNKKGSGSLSTNSDTGDGASKTTSTPRRSSTPWLFALILLMGGLLFHILKRKNKAGNDSRNAKAMNLFVKYSE